MNGSRIHRGASSSTQAQSRRAMTTTAAIDATLPDATIDRASPVPFYFQLAEILEEEIVSGRWEAGARIPSENELCTHYSLSRTTIRQALARLGQEGLVRRTRDAARTSPSRDPALG